MPLEHREEISRMGHDGSWQPHSGLSLLEELATQCSFTDSSTEIRIQRIEEIAQITGVIVVGSSGSGKTTFVNKIKQAIELSALPPALFPPRLTTRPPRQNDDYNENQFVSDADFDRLVTSSILDAYWSRDLGSNSEFRYGFLATQANRPRIFSANNALLLQPDAGVRSLLQQSVVIQLFSPRYVRASRLGTRSPDIVETEMDHRIDDRGLDTYSSGYTDIVARAYDCDAGRTDKTIIMQIAKAVIQGTRA
jgi:ribose 1,5-bisphosphokinase PhnN